MWVNLMGLPILIVVMHAYDVFVRHHLMFAVIVIVSTATVYCILKYIIIIFVWVQFVLIIDHTPVLGLSTML